MNMGFTNTLFLTLFLSVISVFPVLRGLTRAGLLGWFVMYIFIVVTLLFLDGIILLPIIILLIYVSAIPVVLIATFLALPEDSSSSSTKVLTSTVGLRGALALVSFSSGIAFVVASICWHAPIDSRNFFILNSTNQTALLLQKHVFYNPDIVCFYPLLAGFSWLLLLIGVFIWTVTLAVTMWVRRWPV